MRCAASIVEQGCTSIALRSESWAHSLPFDLGWIASPICQGLIYDRHNPIEVSVDVNLQQRPRMIGRPPCRLRLDAAKAQLGQIKLIDKDIDCPNRIIFRQIV